MVAPFNLSKNSTKSLTKSSLKGLAQLLKDNVRVDPDSSILIGYSGGLDSSLLLHAAAIAYPEEKILALHCNHGISNQAQNWADHCKEEARLLNISFTEKKLNLGEKASEETSRNARYQFFSEHMQPLQRPVLLLGHHADDQVETLLFRMFRGSGLKGLSAIPQSRDLAGGKLVRPFLGIRKTVLHDIARKEAVNWIEDESNQTEDYDRNFLRNRLLPLVYQRWPKAAEQLLQARSIFEESDRLLDEYAERLLAGLEPREAAFGQSYSMTQFKNLTAAQYRMVLRYLVCVSSSCANCSYGGSCSRSGIQLTHSELKEIEAQFFYSKADAKPKFKIGNTELRRYKDRLYILVNLPKERSEAISIQWDGKQPLEIMGLGTLSLASSEGVAPKSFDVRFRQGRERAKPLARDHSQTLKKLMQEFEIEPWLRSRIPLIFLGDKLLSVGDSIYCSEHTFIWQWKSVPELKAL